jgi:FkbM family methyltransferase
MTYYGQFDPPTDKIIADYFDPNYIGVAVEVGAAQGIAASNTLYFEQRGWRCLCIEPNPILFGQLQRNRKYVLNYAVGSRYEDGVDFHVCTGDGTAVSALDLDRELMKQNNISEDYIIKVNVRTLDFCLKNFFTPIDFVSIDTEGTELDVLKGFNIEFYNPKLLVIENNFNNPNIDDYLKDFGYKKIKRHIINDFYGRNL